MSRLIPRLTPFRGALLAGAGGFAAYKTMSASEKNAEKDFSGAPLKRKIQRFNSLVDRGQNPQEIKNRKEMLAALKSGELFDVVIVGAGCTGAGAALDSAARGLKTACIERGDFANETSSRSSKLIWGGFKYLQVAFAELLNRRTLIEPVTSFQKFWGEFMMVYECCQERSWLAGQQPHLVEYVPQAVGAAGRHSSACPPAAHATRYPPQPVSTHEGSLESRQRSGSLQEPRAVATVLQPPVLFDPAHPRRARFPLLRRPCQVRPCLHLGSCCTRYLWRLTHGRCLKSGGRLALGGPRMKPPRRPQTPVTAPLASGTGGRGSPRTIRPRDCLPRLRWTHLTHYLRRQLVCSDLVCDDGQEDARGLPTA